MDKSENVFRMNEKEEGDSSDVNIKEMLDLQLSEVEMLRSMFPNCDEFKLDDEIAVYNIQAYVNGDIQYKFLQSRLGFTLNIIPENCKVKVELVCQLPHEYPSVSPVVFTRAPDMSRANHRKLNEDLHDFILSIEKGEICMYSVTEWIQENLNKYENKNVLEKDTGKIKIEEDTVLTRLWIYSHHIYSKFKRKDIIDWADELKLTGFSLPGKPGVICVEGYSRPVDEYWHRLRRLNWKRLMIKDKDDLDIGDEDINKHKKFSNFEEKVFDVRGGKGREYHMDLGLFYEFLEEHGFGSKFQSYFGVEGKPTSSS